jgi:hypothetical protein
MSIGAGFAAAGECPAGTGDVDQGSIPSGNLFVDASGVRQPARAINPTTRQYVLNSDGSMSGMPGSLQLVQLRIQTLRDSSALPGFGKRAVGGVVTDQTPRRLQADVEECLADLVASGIITIVSIDVQRSAKSQVYGVVTWRDVASGIEVPTEI